MAGVMDVQESDPIAQRLADLLGDAQKEFKKEACSFKLGRGSMYGGYGSFLPSEFPSPASITSRPKDKSSPHAVLEAQRLLGDAQKEFKKEARSFKLGRGSMYGGYGSFLRSEFPSPTSIIYRPKDKSSPHAVLEVLC